MEKEKKDWRPIWLYILITILTSFLAGFALIIISILNGKDPHLSNELLGALSTILSDIVVAIIFYFLYRKRLKKDIKRLNKKNIIYIIVSAVVLISLNELISYLFRILEVEMNNQDAIKAYLHVYKIPMIICIVTLAPFIEEITFRYSIETICKNNYLFVIVSSIVFGLAHGLGIATLLYIFIGTCISIAYIKNDKNIVVPISIHILNNLVAAIEMLLLS